MAFQRLSECFKNFIKIFDQYAQPVRLEFQLSKVFQTNLGGLISIILYLGFIAVVIYLYADVGMKNNVAVTTYYNRYADPPEFNFTYHVEDLDYDNDQNTGFFFFGFLIWDDNGNPI